jgi:hypothetical protein
MEGSARNFDLNSNTHFDFIPPISSLTLFVYVGVILSSPTLFCKYSQFIYCDSAAD